MPIKSYYVQFNIIQLAQKESPVQGFRSVYKWTQIPLQDSPLSNKQESIPIHSLVKFTQVHKPPKQDQSKDWLPDQLMVHKRWALVELSRPLQLAEVS